jgi:pyrroloquinoline quinone (PQQ) biosynthesis protein C
MKKQIKPFDSSELVRKYPLADLVSGWFFRCEEISSGVYEVEGIDIWGRTVSATGMDPESLIARCVTDAKRIALSCEER